MKNGYSTVIDKGNVKAGQFDWVWVPSNVREDLPPAILFHGAGSSYMWGSAGNMFSTRMAAFLAMNGIPCVASEFDGDAWGNDSAMAAADSALNYLGTVMGVAYANCFAVGVSMGAFTALRYSWTRPGKVRAMVGGIPLTNLTAFYAAHPEYQAGIATPWGVAAGAALPAATQVQENAAAINVPKRLYYSHADSLVNPADTVAFANASPNSTAIDVGAHDHSDTTLGDILALGDGMGSDFIDFLIANGG